MAEEQKLTKNQKKELRKIEWQEKARLEARNEKIKKYSIWGIGTLIVIGAIAGLVWLVSASPTSNQSEAVNVAPISSKDITKGNLRSKVTLIEYADFQCPACATYHPFVNQLLTDEGNKILYAYRMFPLTNAHPNSHISAQAAYAAKKQAKFFEMSDLLFNNQTDWALQQDPRSIFLGYAKSLKLNTDQFEKDMNSDEAKNYVNTMETQAISEGMNSTPTFVLNGNKITNPNNYQDFKKLVDDQINKK